MVYNYGTGSGSITIDGSKTKFLPGDTIKLKGGKYNFILIQNCIGSAASPINIITDGTQVELLSNTSNVIPLSLANVQYVVIDGGVAAGFYIHDLSYRGMSVSGNPTGIVLSNFLFKNIKDYSIAYDYNDAYPAVASGMKILNCEFANAGQINFQGDCDKGVITGYIKGIEIAGCNFHDSPTVGTVASCGNVENYYIHHNMVNNINQSQNDHNAIFFMQGNGSFCYNKITNHQGNAIRAWGFTMGTVPKQVLIFNNIVCNSRKYSGFEVQSFSTLITSGKTTYVNALVCGNTCGNMNLTHDWVGGVVDVYNLFGGTCDVFDNIAYNTYPANTVANQQSTLVPKTYNNLTGVSYSDVGITDENTFKLTGTSKAIGGGVANAVLPNDFYSVVRQNPPSIGAVEYVSAANSGSSGTPTVTITTLPAPPVVTAPPPASISVPVADLQALQQLVTELQTWIANHT